MRTRRVAMTQQGSGDVRGPGILHAVATVVVVVVLARANARFFSVMLMMLSYIRLFTGFLLFQC